MTQWPKVYHMEGGGTEYVYDDRPMDEHEELALDEKRIAESAYSIWSHSDKSNSPEFYWFSAVNGIRKAQEEWNDYRSER